MTPCIPLGILLNPSLRSNWSLSSHMTSTAEMLQRVMDVRHARNDVVCIRAARDAGVLHDATQNRLHYASEDAVCTKDRPPHPSSCKVQYGEKKSLLSPASNPRPACEHPGNAGIAMLEKGNKILWT